MRAVLAISSLACFTAGAADVGVINVRLVPALFEPGPGPGPGPGPESASEPAPEPAPAPESGPGPVPGPGPGTEPDPPTFVLHFPRARASLDLRAKTKLARAAGVLSREPTLRAEIAGHADRVGSEEQNDSLSLRRARAVSAALLEHGIAKERLILESLGERRPVDERETADALAANRRVELRLRRSTR